MAKVCVVAVFDSAVQAFGRPIFVPAIGAGIRSFSDEVNRKAEGNGLYDHPEDFSLWYLGLFDEDSGTFIDTEGKRSLLRGQDVERKVL